VKQVLQHINIAETAMCQPHYRRWRQSLIHVMFASSRAPNVCWWIDSPRRICCKRPLLTPLTSCGRHRQRAAKEPIADAVRNPA